MGGPEPEQFVRAHATDLLRSAVLLPLRLDWSPLGFGLLWSGTLAAVGLHLRRLGRETDNGVAHDYRRPVDA